MSQLFIAIVPSSWHRFCAAWVGACRRPPSAAFKYWILLIYFGYLPASGRRVGARRGAPPLYAYIRAPRRRRRQTRTAAAANAESQASPELAALSFAAPVAQRQPLPSA